MEPQSIRIVLVDDQHLVRRDIADYLQRRGFDVVGDTGDEGEAVRLVHDLRPHAVVLDCRFGGKSLGEDILVRLKRGAPECPVVVYTACPPDAQCAVAHGASEVIPKSIRGIERLVTALTWVTDESPSRN